MKKIFWVCLILLLFNIIGVSKESIFPQKKDFHIFLLAGQSNMAGRGIVKETDQTIHPRVFMLSKEGEWVPAVDPVHYDKSVAGVGPGKSFALALAEHDTSVMIGLVPAACGGSPIDTWKPGGYHDQTKSHPYDDAIARVTRAMQDGELKAILWHQGGSDCVPGLAETYKGKLVDLIARFRKDLESPDLPFIIGQMGKFKSNPWNESTEIVNRSHIETAEEIANTGFVTSDSLTCKADNIHFDAISARELGRRYAKAYLKMIK